MEPARSELAASAPDADASWHQLVLWAESNLRGQIERSLPEGGPVTATTVIHSALRRAVERRERLDRGFHHAQAFLAGVARRVRSEKFRRERAQRRSPEGASVLPLQDGDAGTSSNSGGDARLWNVVSELPENLRLLLEALYREGLTFGEYARRIGQSEKQVERAHQRALHQLRRRSRAPEDPA